MTRFPITAACLLAVVLVGVNGIRAWQLATGGLALDGLDERAWRGWSYRGPAVPEVFAGIAACPEAAGPLVLRVPREAGWWKTMAHYYLPGSAEIEVVATPLLTVTDLRDLGLLGPGDRGGRTAHEKAQIRAIRKDAERAGWMGDPAIGRTMRERIRRLMREPAARVSGAATAWVGEGGRFQLWRGGRWVCRGGSAR